MSVYVVVSRHVETVLETLVIISMWSLRWYNLITEHSEFKTVLLEHCKKVEAKLRAVKAAFGTENHIIIWTDIREIFPVSVILSA